jgi:hypothetical protein
MIVAIQRATASSCFKPRFRAVALDSKGEVVQPWYTAACKWLELRLLGGPSTTYESYCYISGSRYWQIRKLNLTTIDEIVAFNQALRTAVDLAHEKVVDQEALTVECGFLMRQFGQPPLVSHIQAEKTSLVYPRGSSPLSPDLSPIDGLKDAVQAYLDLTSLRYYRRDLLSSPAQYNTQELVAPPTFHMLHSGSSDNLQERATAHG